MAHSNINDSAIKAYINGPDGPVMRWLIRFANRVRNGAVQRCNVRTGRLATSIQVTLRIAGPGPVARVGTDVEYARHVHQGTRPHVITPKRAGGVLRFVGPGGVVFTRKVNHPGYKGNPFLSDALADEMRTL